MGSGTPYEKKKEISALEEHRFSSCMKQNKKAKIYVSFASPEKKIIILYLRCDCEANFL
jgi:hypothetical protein